MFLCREEGASSQQPERLSIVPGERAEDLGTGVGRRGHGGETPEEDLLCLSSP